MRRLLPLVLLMLAVPLSAQQATLNTPVARASLHNYRVESYYATREGGGRWQIEVSIRDSGGNEIERQSFSGPDAAHSGATGLAFVNAQVTAVPGETGSNVRRMDARLLDFLIDHNYITGVTLAP